MIYINNKNEQENINRLLDSLGRNISDIASIDKLLEDNDYTFASIIKEEDNSLCMLYDHSFIKLVPLGGIYEATGKYKEFDKFDRDLELFDETLMHDSKKIISGDIDVVNLGEIYHK